jgi:phosphoribosylglycinamide formyltransferase 1
VKPAIAVLISGRGTNLQAISDAIDAGKLDAQIAVIICNEPQAEGLSLAEQLGLNTVCLNHRDFDSREQYDQALLEVLQQYPLELVVLAGFMRRLTPRMVSPFLGKMVNIHPSLLPLHPGLDTHQAVLDEGDEEHGCSVHFVTNELDAGPVIAQARLSVGDNDTADSLRQRVHQLEYQLYWRLISLFLGRNIVFCNGRVACNNQLLPPSGMAIPAD